jgi:hypothetical protein
MLKRTQNIVCVVATIIALGPQIAAAVDFESEIRPLLNKHCVNCHGPTKQKADLRLDAKSWAFKGGESGPAIVSGKSTESPLYERIAASDDAIRMPPTGSPLSADEIARIKTWIDSGAAWPESAADQAAAVDKRRQHWAWQPLQRPRHGAQIDDFIQAKLNEHNQTLNPPADPRTLVRRLYFDVVGLPPTPEEVDEWIQRLAVGEKLKAEGRKLEDNNAAEELVAYRDSAAFGFQLSALVDALLASPRYGEKWARHWLDVVRFAESDGFEMNRARANAWPYRDYVIQAFNVDKPFDQFIREQLVGDALGVDAATGFLVGGAVDRVKSKDPVLTANQRADELHDMVSTTAATFLGITLNCARCHDHKFDPIPTKDYYGFVALLQGVNHGERLWRERAESLPMTDDKQLRPAVIAGLNEDSFPPIDARFVRFTITASSAEPCIDELEVFNTGGENVARFAKVVVSDTFANGTTAKHKSEFINDGRYGNDRSWISGRKEGGWAKVEFANVQRIDHVVWSRDRSGSGGPRFTDRLATGYHIDVSRDGEQWQTVSSSKDRATSSPVGPQVYAGTFQTPGPTRRMHRGDPTQPREEISPAALSQIGTPLPLAANASEQQRRVALANWIASADNPLTARVIVNRLWHHHFGTGLVDTPSDFCLNGSRPTHPELLDFLASELIDHGWSLKHIHRLILNSRTFQQSSANREPAARVDAQARLLWRYPPRRLEAEALRDTMLAVSGQLDLTMGGPGFDLFEPNEN